MKKASKFTFIVFLIGVNLLSACSQAAASTTEPITPAATSAPLPTATPASLTEIKPLPLPASGFLAPGTYFLPKKSGARSAYSNLIFTVPAGWAINDGFVNKYLGQPNEMTFSVWVVDQVYADPCHWQGSALSPLDLTYHIHTSDPTGVILLAPENEGLAQQALRGPLPRATPTVNLGNNIALRIDLSVPTDLDISTCDSGEFRSWTEWGPVGGANSHASGANSHHASGQLDSVYMVDIDRGGFVIDASHMPATSKADLAELDAILASIFIDGSSDYETLSSASWYRNTGPLMSSEGDPGPAVIQGTQLNPGSYDYLSVDGTGFNVKFTVPAGWTWNGWYLSKGGFDQPDRATIFFFGGPVQVYADPCKWGIEAQGKPHWVTGLSDGGLMAALIDQPMRSATTPIDRPASSLYTPIIWPGTAVELTTADNFDLSNCYGGHYQSWGSEINFRSFVDQGQRDIVWAVDIIGAGDSTPPPQGGLIIDAASFPGTPADVMSEIESILGSIIVGHWG